MNFIVGDPIDPILIGRNPLSSSDVSSKTSLVNSIPPFITKDMKKHNIIDLESKCISRVHAKIFQKNGIFYLLVVGTNGIKVNGEFFRKKSLLRLDNKDILDFIGTLYMFFTFEAESESIELSNLSQIVLARPSSSPYIYPPNNPQTSSFLSVSPTNYDQLLKLKQYEYTGIQLVSHKNNIPFVQSLDPQYSSSSLSSSLSSSDLLSDTCQDIGSKANSDFRSCTLEQKHDPSGKFSRNLLDSYIQTQSLIDPNNSPNRSRKYINPPLNLSVVKDSLEYVAKKIKSKHCSNQSSSITAVPSSETDVSGVFSINETTCDINNKVRITKGSSSLLSFDHGNFKGSSNYDLQNVSKSYYKSSSHIHDSKENKNEKGFHYEDDNNYLNTPISQSRLAVNLNDSSSLGVSNKKRQYNDTLFGSTRQKTGVVVLPTDEEIRFQTSKSSLKISKVKRMIDLGLPPSSPPLEDTDFIDDSFTVDDFDMNSTLKENAKTFKARSVSLKKISGCESTKLQPKLKTKSKYHKSSSGYTDKGSNSETSFKTSSKTFKKSEPNLKLASFSKSNTHVPKKIDSREMCLDFSKDINNSDSTVGDVGSEIDIESGENVSINNLGIFKTTDSSDVLVPGNVANVSNESNGYKTYKTNNKAEENNSESFESISKDMIPSIDLEWLASEIVCYLALNKKTKTTVSELIKAISTDILPCQFINVLENNECFGKLARTKLDANNHKVEDYYYYIPEKDSNVARKLAFSPLIRPSRKCTLIDAQYYYKPIKM
ncbi:hypothetical protein BB560_001604 [Smittium megazygosporum]|uniref:FHA domain-containing protein n=1 Tax=Smittium megazygosporum TaxID=133381 RepID=A0A2T9ZH35_9FUNG|nr:hypothetical protein BB560_001604 [Smittium megazygosporum]